MGTIASRDCLAILELSETVAAIVQLAVVQAVDLRGVAEASRGAKRHRDAIRQSIPAVTGDRRQDGDIETVLEMYRSGALPIGALSR